MDHVFKMVRPGPSRALYGRPHIDDIDRRHDDHFFPFHNGQADFLTNVKTGNFPLSTPPPLSILEG